MRPVFTFALAIPLILALQPAYAQMSPASRSPAASVPFTPPPYPSGADAGGGLCQCVYRSGTPVGPYSNQVLGLKCLSAVEDCKSMCQTQSNFTFVPHAAFSCRGLPGESTAKVALNTRQ